MATKRMTVGQAIIEFLGHQYTVDGDVRVRTIAGTYGIFGHGNVAGIGQALLQYSIDEPDLMPYHQARNEQGMVHESIAYARMTRRMSTYANAASVGPGATNMLTGAAVATTNRLPVLLLPSDTFANRAPDPVLQQLEMPHDASLSVNDAFKPLSRFFDRIQRPEQVFSAMLSAMRVLTDPVETGAVTVCVPEDVQAEVIDVPLEWLADRDWHIRRPRAERSALEAAAKTLRRVQAGRTALEDMEAALSGIELPVLLLVGDEDEPWLRLGVRVRPDENAVVDEALALAEAIAARELSSTEVVEALAQQAGIGRLLHQRMLEEVSGLRRESPLVDQLRLH